MNLDDTEPQVPDFLRYMPESVLERTKRYEQADAWAAEQRGVLADHWTAMVKADMQTLAEQAANGTLVPEPVLNVTGSGQDVSPLSDAYQQPAPPAQPTMEDHGRQFAQGMLETLRSLVPGMQVPNSPSEAIQNAAAQAGVPPVPDLTGQQSTEDYAHKVEQAAQHENLITPFGPFNPQLVPPNLQHEEAPPGSVTAPEQPGVKMATGEAGQAAEGAASNAGAEAQAAEAGPSPLDAVVQQAKSLVGEDRVAAAQKHLDNPKMVARFEGIKNPARDLKTQSQRDAYDLWRASKQQDLVDAIQQQNGQKTAEAVVENARDAGLPDLPPPTKPAEPDDMAALDVAHQVDPAAGEAVTRTVARRVAGIYDTVRPRAPKPERFENIPEQNQILPEPPPESPAAKAVREALARGEQPDEGTITGAPPKQPPTGPRVTRGEAPEPQGIDYSHIAASPNKVVRVPPALYGHAANIGGAVAGGLIANQQAQDDDLTTRLIKIAIGAGMGAAAGSILVGPGGLQGIGERAQSRYITGLIGPRSVTASAAQDITNVTLDAPTLRFAESLLKGRPIEGAKESAAMIDALVRGNGVKRGLAEAWQEFNPKTFGDVMYRGEKALGTANEMPSIGQYVSTASTRVLNAWTALIKHVMLAQEEAATRAGSLGPTVQGINVNAADLGELTNQQVARRLFLGEPEGAIGQLGMKAGQVARNVPVVGPILQPFVHIPAVYMDQTLSSIPIVGLLNAIGAKNASAVVARNLRGAMFTAGIAGLMAATGSQITGGGPADPSLNKEWRDLGYQPYSVKPPGSNKWVSIQNMPPVLKAGLLFLGSLDDFRRYGVEPKQLGQTAKEFGRSLGATDFVPTLARFALGDLPIAQQARSQITSFFPWYSRQTATAQRPYTADTKGTENLPPAAGMPEKVGAAVQAGAAAAFPGEVPARQTATGQPVPNANQGAAGLLSPFHATQEAPDRVIAAFANVGMNIPDPPPSVSFGSGTKAVSVDLSGQQQREFQRLRGEFLSEHAPDGGFASPQQAQALLRAADTYAKAQFAPLTATEATKPSSVKRTETASQKAAFWKRATSGQPANAPLSSKPAPAPTKSASSAAFWKKKTA